MAPWVPKVTNDLPTVLGIGPIEDQIVEGSNGVGQLRFDTYSTPALLLLLKYQLAPDARRTSSDVKNRVLRYFKDMSDHVVSYLQQSNETHFATSG